MVLNNYADNSILQVPRKDTTLFRTVHSFFRMVAIPLNVLNVPMYVPTYGGNTPERVQCTQEFFHTENVYLSC